MRGRGCFRWHPQNPCPVSNPPPPPPPQAAGGDANIAAELFLESGGDVVAAEGGGAAGLAGGAVPSLDRDEALARSLAAMVGGVDE